MNKHYQKIEMYFEKLASIATSILGNSITFILALCLIVFWIVTKMFHEQSIDYCIRDIIHGVTFLSLFIIQKSFNRFSAILHLKVNELVSSHETANNSVLNLEIKTEHELTEMSKEYEDLVKENEEEVEEQV